MTRLAIFDCDGTLVDSQANIVAAIGMAFRDVSLPAPARAQALRIVGLSLYEAMQRLHPHGTPEVHDALAEGYKLAFRTLRMEGSVAEPLYDGIADTLDDLTAAGWLLGVATGKSDRGLALCLAHHGLTDRFVTLQTADRHPSKPHPSMIHQAMADAGADPEETVMIGDTSFDIGMAKAARVTAIGVAWGYHDRAELVAEGADLVVDTPADLTACLGRRA
jgi:phosphoglycolate phosphatase